MLVEPLRRKTGRYSCFSQTDPSRIGTQDNAIVQSAEPCATANEDLLTRKVLGRVVSPSSLKREICAFRIKRRKESGHISTDRNTNFILEKQSTPNAINTLAYLSQLGSCRRHPTSIIELLSPFQTSVLWIRVIRLLSQVEHAALLDRLALRGRLAPHLGQWPPRALPWASCTSLSWASAKISPKRRNSSSLAPSNASCQRSGEIASGNAGSP